MYPTVTHIKSGKQIQLFSPEVNKLLDDDYTIEEILKTFTYNTNKYQMILPKEILMACSSRKLVIIKLLCYSGS